MKDGKERGVMQTAENILERCGSHIFNRKRSEQNIDKVITQQRVAKERKKIDT